MRPPSARLQPPAVLSRENFIVIPHCSRSQTHARSRTLELFKNPDMALLLDAGRAVFNRGVLFPAALILICSSDSWKDNR